MRFTFDYSDIIAIVVCCHNIFKNLGTERFLFYLEKRSDKAENKIVIVVNCVANLLHQFHVYLLRSNRQQTALYQENTYRNRSFHCLLSN